MLNWFYLTLANSSNFTNLIQNRKNSNSGINLIANDHAIPVKMTNLCRSGNVLLKKTNLTSFYVSVFLLNLSRSGNQT